MTRDTLRRYLLIAAGSLSLALGIVGVFVPLLPTTPFLLVAAACYVRSSARMHAWLMGHRWLGPYIRHYREHRAITRWARRLALALLWASIGYGVVAVAETLWLRALLLAIAIGVTWHLMSLSTWRPVDDEAEKDG